MLELMLDPPERVIGAVGIVYPIGPAFARFSAGAAYVSVLPHALHLVDMHH